MPESNLDGCIAVVGAAGLVGRTLVSGLLEKNYRIVAADVSQQALDALLATVSSNNLETVVTDITSEDSVSGLLAYCQQTMGGMVGAVNCSYPRSANYGQDLLSVSIDDFNESINLHLGGYFLFTRQCLAYSIDHATPFSLVNFSSVYGSMAPDFSLYEGTSMTMPVEYAAIKSAVIQLNRYMAAYVKTKERGRQFRINSVSPGGLLDGQNSAFLDRYGSRCVSKGMLDPADLTGAVGFLLSTDSLYVTGQDIVVDDGFTL